MTICFVSGDTIFSARANKKGGRMNAYIILKQNHKHIPSVKPLA